MKELTDKEKSEIQEAEEARSVNLMFCHVHVLYYIVGWRELGNANHNLYRSKILFYFLVSYVFFYLYHATH